MGQAGAQSALAGLLNLRCLSAGGPLLDYAFPRPPGRAA